MIHRLAGSSPSHAPIIIFPWFISSRFVALPQLDRRESNNVCNKALDSDLSALNFRTVLRDPEMRIFLHFLRSRWKNISLDARISVVEAVKSRTYTRTDYCNKDDSALERMLIFPHCFSRGRGFFFFSKRWITFARLWIAKFADTKTPGIIKTRRAGGDVARKLYELNRPTPVPKPQRRTIFIGRAYL